MKRTWKRRILIFVIVLVSPILLNRLPMFQDAYVKEVFAAEIKGARLAVTEYTMGVTESTSGGNFIEKFNNDADYSYKSSNKKVVTVNDYELRGISKGTATITVTETLYGKSREVGKVKIKVVSASLDKEFTVGLSGSEQTVGFLVPINYKTSESTYTYQSSDPKTVEISEYGNIYSKKYGSAYISITEKYKGKVTKLGKIKVNIVKAKPAYKKLTIPVSVDGYKVESLVNYPKRKNTTYIFTSSNKKILEVEERNDDYIYAKNYGTAKITITEMDLSTKKKTVIGTTTIEIKPITLDPAYKNVELEYNTTESLLEIFDYFNFKYNFYATYSCMAADNSILATSSEKHKVLDDYEVERSFKRYDIKALKKGKTKLTIYEEYKGVKTEIGTINVVVKETIYVFAFDPNEFDYVDGMLSTAYDLDDEYPYYNVMSNIIKEPYHVMSTVRFSSSNKKVFQVDNKGNITVVAKGTAILKATCDDWTAELRITVK